MANKIFEKTEQLNLFGDTIEEAKEIRNNYKELDIDY